MKVFVSHNHQDKSIARRIVRFLRAYGAEAWLDERELRLGSRLDDSIQAAIRQSDALVVVASEAAARSEWVQREVAFASDSAPPVAVCPIYVDNVIAHPSFAPHLGIDAQDRYQFRDVLVKLAESLVGSPLPPIDERQLQAGLDELSRQNSAIGLLADGCLRGEGLRYEHVQLVAETSFHDLDDALDAISRLGGGSRAASATAALFARTGAGSAALSRYIAGGHSVLDMAVGVPLDRALLDTAVRLLSLPNPPDNQALASFLWKNTEALGREYRDRVIRLVTHPARGPAHSGAAAAAAALGVFPDDDDLVILWQAWIREQLFDGGDQPGAGVPQSFAYWSAEGLRAGSNGWRRVFDYFVGHVGRLARTKSRQAVHSALQHMMHAADRNNPRVAEIVSACQAAVGAAEWDGWEDRDEMSNEVLALTAEALGQRRWGEAMNRADQSWQARLALRRAKGAQ